MDKYLSIITNFGCHYKCPYCIVKNNKIDVPKTTVEGLKLLARSIWDNDCNIVSVSGGGDPLFKYGHPSSPEVEKWWRELLITLVSLDIPLEVHTSYAASYGARQVAKHSKRMVYHLHSIEDLYMVSRFANELVRVVFVVTDDMSEVTLDFIADCVSKNPGIDELTFRQRVDKDYKVSYHLHDYLKDGHKKKWWYVEQYDYNLYYAENRVYEKYSDFINKGDENENR